jgi:hypothetical protein
MMNLLGYDAMVYIYIHIFIQFSTWLLYIMLCLFWFFSYATMFKSIF